MSTDNAEAGSGSLLGTRRFLPLFITQFSGALNDNVLKNAMVVLVAFDAIRWSRLDIGVLANLAGGVFILPFFLFSATAGQLADKFDKARLARFAKALEIAIVCLAGVGFFVESLLLLAVALFFLGLQSTLFGPVKYAILPQHLSTSELIGGNAFIEAGTFVAILLGTIIGGLLASLPSASLYISAAGLLIAICGYLSSRAIPAALPPMPQLAVSYNPVMQTWRTLALARRQPRVFLAIIGISWFWLFGALFLAQFPEYSRDLLGGDELTVTLLLAVFTVGIGAGSMLCECLCRGKIETGYVLPAAIGLSVFGLEFSAATAALPLSSTTVAPLDVTTLLSFPLFWRILFDLVIIGIFGGLFIVPLYALMQAEADPDCRARIVAANNIMNALFIVAGAVGAAWMLGSGLPLAGLFATAAFVNAGVALCLGYKEPRFRQRLVAWMGRLG